MLEEVKNIIDQRNRDHHLLRVQETVQGEKKLKKRNMLKRILTTTHHQLPQRHHHLWQAHHKQPIYINTGRKKKIANA